MKIAVTGATGLVGAELTRRLIARGDRVVALSRNPDRARGQLPRGAKSAGFQVGNAADLSTTLAGMDAVVNLAGEPILGRRWNRAVMEEIRRSRVEGTRTVVRAIRDADRGPGTLVNASAVGYYGPRGDEPVDESGEAGDDFLARVCTEWEGAAREAENDGVRVVRLRLGVVLSLEEGALAQMLPLFRKFLGGPIGRGRQGFSFIHLADACRLFERAIHDESVSGPVNVTAPNPVSNREFAKTLGRVLHRPAWLPTPGFALRLVLGRVARMLLTGQFVVPRVAEEMGFPFEHATAESAIRDLLAR